MIRGTQPPKKKGLLPVLGAIRMQVRNGDDGRPESRCQGGLEVLAQVEVKARYNLTLSNSQGNERLQFLLPSYSSPVTISQQGHFFFGWLL